MKKIQFRKILSCTNYIILLVIITILTGRLLQATEETFVSFGSSGIIQAGSLALPMRLFNPAELPFTVPKGKALLLYGIFFESDPPLGDAMLMAMFISKNNKLNTLRTIHLRQPASIADNLTSPIVVPEGWMLNVLFSNSSPSSQAFNWSVQARLVDASLTVEKDVLTNKNTKLKTNLYPPVKLHLDTTEKTELYEALKEDFYITEQYSEEGHITVINKTLHAELKKNELLINFSKNYAGRITTATEDFLVLDNNIFAEAGDFIFPANIAKSGSTNGLIVDPNHLQDCMVLNNAKVFVLSAKKDQAPARQITSVAACINGQISLNPVQATEPTVSVEPGDIYILIK